MCDSVVWFSDGLGVFGMKAKFGGGVAEARGSIAGTTFSRNKGGSYARQRVTPVNPQTAAQQAQRSRISELATHWGQTLTQAQRDGWVVFAENFPITDVFGDSLVLSGAQGYTRINSRLLAAGQTRIDTAPSDQAVTDLTSASAVIELTGGTAVITFAPTPVGANDHVQVFATPGVSPGVSFMKNKLRLLVTSSAAQATGLDVATEYIARFGALPVAGQKVGLRVRTIRNSNGAVDASLVADTIVIA